MVVYKLLVLDKNAWNYINVCKLLVLDIFKYFYVGIICIW